MEVVMAQDSTDKIAKLKALREESRLGGGEKRIAAQHEKGKALRALAADAG